MGRKKDKTPLLDWKYFQGMQFEDDGTDDKPKNMVDLADGSWVIGFTGVRGGGKTIFAVWLACFCMVNCGFPVWSNVAIKFRCKCFDGKTRTFESLPLDMEALYSLSSEFQSGVLLIDEANLFVDSRNSMSLSSRLVNAAVQQTRKRSLSILWTAQNEEWLDNRLRFSTDLIIHTKDMAKTPWGLRNHQKKGVSFSWDAWDMSGQWTGHSVRDNPYPVLTRQIFNGELLWPVYDTYLAQDIIAANRKVRINQAPITIGEDGKVAVTPDVRRDAVAQVINYLKGNGQERVSSDDLWDAIESTGLDASREVLGRDLRQLGAVRKQTTGGRYDYILPPLTSPDK